MKLTWLTDIHLNFLEIEERITFYNSIVQTHGDAMLLSGDIAEAPSLISLLQEIANHIKKPIYFVLGNHDYYRGQVDDVKAQVYTLMKKEKLLHWLPKSGPITLSNDVVLLGQDGWADGRYGDYANSDVRLNDSRIIADLRQESVLGKYPLLKKMQQLADTDANLLQHDIINAIKQHQPKKIIVVTHVPPFKESCLYEGKVSNDDFLPFFSSKATGDVLLKFARQHSAIEFLVLAGHTHGEAYYQPLNNLIIKVGGAEYGQPIVQEVFDC